jgi:hypothetical protein
METLDEIPKPQAVHNEPHFRHEIERSCLEADQIRQPPDSQHGDQQPESITRLCKYEHNVKSSGFSSGKADFEFRLA